MGWPFSKRLYFTTRHMATHLRCDIATQFKEKNKTDTTLPFYFTVSLDEASEILHLHSRGHKQQYQSNIEANINPLTPNDPYSGRNAPLTSKRCILYIYSTNIGTEHFKRGINSPFFSSSKCSLFHNSSVFGSCINHILYTGCAKI